MASWCDGWGACLPFFPCSFPLGSSHSGIHGQGAGGDLPIGCFFQLWGCPASALAVAGKGGSVLRAHPFFGTVAWCLFKTFLFPSYATRCRYDVPGVLASGSGLPASACSCACGRCLRIVSVLVLAFHSSLFLVGASSNGSAHGDRCPLPWADVSHSLRFG